MADHPAYPSERPALSERELFEAVYCRMRTLAGNNAHDLDDLAQLAAEQVFAKLRSFQGRSELLTWVYAVCYRVLLKHRRWHRRWSMRFRLEQEDDPVLSDDSLPSIEVEMRERARLLQNALGRLNERQRAVVVLHDLEELKVAEIAAIVDCNELTVRSRLRDGRKLLRALLSADEPRLLEGMHDLTPS